MKTPKPRNLIELPERFTGILAEDRRLQGPLMIALERFSTWFSDNKLVFFPGYTDHGPRHIEEVLVAASHLIAEESWEHVTASDVTVLVLSVLLHDSAMHLSDDGFLRIIESQQLPRHRPYPEDLPWARLWESFMFEAKRLPERRRVQVFGDALPVREPPSSTYAWTDRDRLLIGEFLRLHHTRLAFEFAINGVPGARDKAISISDLPAHIVSLAGMVARSHGESIRDAIDRLPHEGKREQNGVHTPFLMALLRIADYLQIHAGRAPRDLLNLRSLRSPFSRREWLAHDAVRDIRSSERDPECLWVDAEPTDVGTFLKLRNLLTDIQAEVDSSWAALGEVYGSASGELWFGLNVRRIRSTLDDLESFGRGVDFVPKRFGFTASSGDLLQSLVRPLYGDDPSIALRELLQNAIDAVSELETVQGPAHSADCKSPIAIRLVQEHDGLWLEVEDFGVGMTEDTISRYFLNAGASYRTSVEWKLKHEDDDGGVRTLRSGRFGVGALAAFLAGDRIRVHTRHYTSAEAFAFEAHLGQDVIPVLKSSRPRPGTTVGIRLTPNIAATTISSWLRNWYRLAEPQISLVGFPAVDRPSWRTPSLVPAPKSELPAPWHRLVVEGYDDVHWAFEDGEHSAIGVEGPGKLFCNGFFVCDWKSDARALVRDYGHEIATPSLSVFDRQGQFPLNLQRSGLTGDCVPFHDELLQAVVGRLIASIVDFRPRQPRNILAWQCRGAPSHFGETLIKEMGFFRLGVCNAGAFLFHPLVAHEVVDDMLMVVHEEDWLSLLSSGVDLSDLPPVVLLNTAPMDDNEFGWDYFSLGQDFVFSTGVGVARDWIIGMEALVPKRARRRGALVRPAGKIAQKDRTREHRVLGSIPDKRLSPILLSLPSELRAAIWHLRPRHLRDLPEDATSSMLASEWLRVAGGPILPWIG